MVDTFLLAKSFVTLLVITDPVGTVPIFLAITAEWGTRDRNRAAWQAVVVAALVIATFALFGQQILIYLGISVPSLQIAGGLLLVVIALDLLRGETESMSGVTRSNVAFVPLGTPLLAGPGAIATVIVLMRRHDDTAGRVSVVLGIAVAILIVGASLLLAERVARHLPEGIVSFLTRGFGLLLSAIAVQLIVDGVRGLTD